MFLVAKTEWKNDGNMEKSEEKSGAIQKATELESTR